MNYARTPNCRLTFRGTVMVIAVWVSMFPSSTHGQTTIKTGNNAVFNSSSSCCTNSTAFIDAYEISHSALHDADLCTTLNKIFSGSTPSSYSPGAVIDARGLVSSSVLTCPTSTSPWFTQSGGYVSKPSTILLPAGTIKISYSWDLPNGTKLIGEGTSGADDISGSALPTTIQATSNFSPMIQFGDSTNCPSSTCTDISIEHLILDGDNQTITGILNQNSQDRSYVNHVTLYRILGTGLAIGANSGGGSAQNSGPYSNINYDTGTSGVYHSTCTSITGLASTRGIHGLSCKSSTDSQVAVLLDSSNNTLRDVTITGFYDGIVVGSNAPARSNVLVNIIGNTPNPCIITCSTPVNTVHISSNSTGGIHNVTDLSVMGARNDGSGTATVLDDLTSTSLPQQYLAMYTLGEPSSNGYSRYTTSPSLPTWSVGNNPPLPSNTCVTGSLYSCISTYSNCGSYALFGCVGTAWVGIK